ncbi:MAG TPA: hypothetical protein VLE47_03635 [Candidatus Saccharimonadales bacterium]|nr:hypothetical protein [Candidatus Saccharimonadales bacterium]
MTKNPLINALAAAVYVVLVSTVMFYGMDHTSTDNTVIVPIAVLSLFSLSAAVMGYLFFYTPFQLYFDQKRKEALNLFLQTVAVFAALTFGLFVVLFFLAYK